MLINFSPIRSDRALEITKIGETLKINGVPYDFSPLADGATLPREAIDCEWICGNVERINGELVIPILLPHGPDASEAARFPEPINVTDGEVVLPE